MPPSSASAGRSPCEKESNSIRLLAMTYDMAIVACNREDGLVADKAIHALRDAVQCVGPEEITDLVAMYDWCLDRVRESDFEPAEMALRGLRDSLLPA